MANTYTLIERITVGAAGASSITFTSIPQTYTDLKIVVSARTNWSNSVNADGINIRPNGSTSSRTAIRLYGSGSAAGSDTNINPIAASNASSTASTFGNAEIYIPNYAGSTNKSMSVDGVSETNGTTTYAGLAAFLWSNTAAITSLDIYPENGTSFSQYSTFYLYGIAKEGVTPADSSAPYATGGDSIVFDGTYWIHTFTSSGTFTPKKGLTCDYLVVAGGGGGSDAGGGGAGGLRCTVTATGGGGTLESALTLLANTSYSVTIGAGGAAGPNNGTGSSGSNSVFSTITSTGGGNGSKYNVANASSGGSGGGGSWNSDANNGSAGAAGTANQGYAGGNANFSGTNGHYPGAGGGGAGAVGGNATVSGNAAAAGGNGGAGVATSITGSSVTYAGGGGGGIYNKNTPGTGGTGGGGNGGGDIAGGTSSTAGTANTGGGGGGGSSDNNANGVPRAGGSGIVIVRYAA
jgi:hypothetical protein